MNRLMSEEQFQLLNSRNIIENVWSVLKLNYNLIYHRARSITGMFRHFFFSISAFLFHKTNELRKEFSSKLCVLENLNFDLIISSFKGLQKIFTDRIYKTSLTQ